MASYSKCVGANGKYRIDGYYPDNSGHDRFGRGTANIRSTASGAQPDVTARQCDEGTEDDALRKTDCELRAGHSAPKLLHETRRCKVQGRDADDISAKEANSAAIEVEQRHHRDESRNPRQNKKVKDRDSKRVQGVDFLVAL